MVKHKFNHRRVIKQFIFCYNSSCIELVQYRVEAQLSQNNLILCNYNFFYNICYLKYSQKYSFENIKNIMIAFYTRVHVRIHILILNVTRFAQRPYIPNNTCRIQISSQAILLLINALMHFIALCV